MKFKRTTTSPKIMIIPMIDIIFFLLVFFMMNMISMVHLKTIPVHLPEASMAQVQTSVDIPITIKKNSDIYVEDKIIQKSELEGSLQRLRQTHTKVEIVLNADENVPHGVVVKVLDEIKNAGIQDVVIATK